MSNKVVKSAAPPNAGKGRVKGVPNRTTALLKDAILLAAERQGQDGNGRDGLAGYCQYLAAEEPRAFAALLGRVLPTQLTGAGGGPIVTVTKEQRDAAVAAFMRADE